MYHSVLDYLSRNLQTDPHKIGYADAKNSLSYKQLNEQSDAIGSFIALNSAARKPIAILAEKSCAVVAAFLGAAKAGCYYVPLDPKHPAARLNTVLETLKPAIILTDAAGERAKKNLLWDNAVLCITLEEALQSDIAPKLLNERRKKALDIDPLYAIFTSGSTGKPKGVLVNHRSVIDFIEEFADTFHFDESDVFGNQAPFDFDVSVKDIYTGLRCGARVELLEKSLFSFPVRLIDRLQERQVTTLVWAVSALVIVSTVDALAEQKPSFLRSFLFSGEAMPIKHLQYWREKYPQARFVNLYGPTEITCNCTYYEVAPTDTFAEDRALPIGSAFANERVFLLNSDDNEIINAGEQGELCVSGTCVTMGYLNDPERTAAAFCPNPLNPSWSEIIYRTGDLAYYGEDGLLYFCGRKDFQIKHMGHRIELQEIEMHIHAVTGVDRCCCVFFKDAEKIVAFYEGSASSKEIIGELRKVVPAFMIPQVFEQLDHLPITANGKIDRTALAQMNLFAENL